MKRERNTYDKVWDWGTLRESEYRATSKKLSHPAVIAYSQNSISNLVAIQEQLANGTMKTADYKYMQVHQRDGKVRDVNYLDFYPAQIHHEAMVIAGESRMDKYLINHTYANRKGKGQTAAAKQVKAWLKEDPDGTGWYAQGDIIKYYDNITAGHARRVLNRLFKDKRYVDAMVEPIEKFGEKGMPLGIRISQWIANLVLCEFDRWVKEDLRIKCYIRYVDDFVVLCATKGECRRFANLAKQKLADMGFEMHVPKVHRVDCGLSYLGYVYYAGGDMYWRRKNKSAWQKRRKGVTNKRRLREIDAAAWGMLKHGNKHCRKLYNMKGVSLKDLGMKPSNGFVEKNGKKYFDAPPITTTVVSNTVIDVLDWEKDVETSHGTGRWVLLIKYHERDYKLIINSMKMKSFIQRLEEMRITSFRTMIVDKTGNRHYDFDFDKTEALTINGEPINGNEYEKVRAI